MPENSAKSHLNINSRQHVVRCVGATRHACRNLPVAPHHNNRFTLLDMQVPEFAVDVEHHAARSYLGVTCTIQISTGTLLGLCLQMCLCLCTAVARALRLTTIK